MTRRPVLVIHGGTGSRPTRERLQRIRRSLRMISRESYDYLQTHSALESVASAVQRLEDDPLFNAGTGSYLQRDGRARMIPPPNASPQAIARPFGREVPLRGTALGGGMSASIMDGSRIRFAAVLNIERVRNPVRVARALLGETDRVFAGAEATRVARSLGCEPWNPVTPARLRQWRERVRGTCGTVGAIALDQEGRLAAATSTGGKGFERPGRVSDSGMPIANFANEAVAVSCTGIGEEIIDEALAARIGQRVLDGVTLARAFSLTFRELSRRGRRVGAIGLDRRGHFAWRTTLPILFAIVQTSTRRVESF